jgi:hypothetical protein
VDAVAGVLGELSRVRHLVVGGRTVGGMTELTGGVDSVTAAGRHATRLCGARPPVAPMSTPAPGSSILVVGAMAISPDICRWRECSRARPPAAPPLAWPSRLTTTPAAAYVGDALALQGSQDALGALSVLAVNVAGIVLAATLTLLGQRRLRRAR